jgi:dihydroneopterin aldolase
MNFSHTSNVQALKIADAKRMARHVFIRDFMVECSIGIHSEEKQHEQRVRINLDLAVFEGNHPVNDDIRNVTCYEFLANEIKKIVDAGHVNLVETLAENIATMCLQDAQVRSVRVRVEKLDILPDAQSVGVEIERDNKV